MKMRKMKVDELLDKCKNLFTRRWNSRPVWTLVERVQDNVNRSSIGDREHVLETSNHFNITWLLCTIVVRRIEAGEDVATGTRLSRKLDEERGEEVATMLFIKVPEIEIKVGHQG